MRLLPLVAVLLASCSSPGGVSDPTGNGNNVLDGIQFTAQAIEIVHEETSVRQLAVEVSLRNTTDEVIQRSYPAGCPVRIRLYRALDDALAYDESQWPCNTTTPVEIELQPGQVKKMTSGPRQPWTVAGDSLPEGVYNAAAVVRLVGETPLELDAGSYRLPYCYQSGLGMACN